MTKFWIIAGLTLIICAMCTLINNTQFFIIKNLLVYLPGVVKKTLMMNGEPDKARNISLIELPKLQKWSNECQNYGIINMFGLLSSIGLIVSGGIYHVLPYIIVLLSALFLASNLTFLPRTLKRLYQVIDINNDYVFLMTVFEQVNDLKKQENKNDTGSSSSP